MKVLFSAEIEIPDGTPEEMIEAWLKYQLGEHCQLLSGNPLADTSVDAIGCTNVWIDRTW
jgi:hypothetical protein